METLAIIVAAPVITILTQRAKDKWWRDTKLTVVAVCCVVGALYVGFQRIAPQWLEDELREFIWQAFAVSWVLYEFVVKHILPTKD